MVGLAWYGATMAFLIEAGLGLDPWDVFHQGLTHHLPLSFGVVTMLVGALVLLLWIPLRQRPAIGTVLNVLIIGLAVDATLAVLPTPEALGARASFLGIGIVGNALAGALYVGAGLGTGPRDGLWVGLVRVTGLSVRLVRTSIELTVLVSGFALGGTVGVGTVLYALLIGPLVQAFLPYTTVAARRPGPADSASARLARETAEIPTTSCRPRSAKRDDAPPAINESSAIKEVCRSFPQGGDRYRCDVVVQSVDAPSGVQN